MTICSTTNGTGKSFISLLVTWITNWIVCMPPGRLSWSRCPRSTISTFSAPLQKKAEILTYLCVDKVTYKEDLVIIVDKTRFYPKLHFSKESSIMNHPKYLSGKILIAVANQGKQFQIVHGSNWPQGAGEISWINLSNISCYLLTDLANYIIRLSPIFSYNTLNVWSQSQIFSHTQKTGSMSIEQK